MSILIDKQTKVICQGFTGSQGTLHSEQAIAYGTQMVGGVTPGKGGQTHLSLPVFDSVRRRLIKRKPMRRLFLCQHHFCRDSIIEAVDAGIGLIVCITEGIPVADMLLVKQYIKHKDVRLIGPNCPGSLLQVRVKLELCLVLFTSQVALVLSLVQER